MGSEIYARNAVGVKQRHGLLAMPQFFHGPDLDLTHTFAGQTDLIANLFRLRGTSRPSQIAGKILFVATQIAQRLAQTFLNRLLNEFFFNR